MTKQKNPRAQQAPKLPDTPAADAPLIEWALWCADIGRVTGAWKVFRCVPGDKRPRENGWQDEAAWERKSVEVMWRSDPNANIGLAIQPCFVALDIDLYKPDAEAGLDRFEATHGQLPRTLEHASARGGLHLIYSATRAFGNGRGALPKFIDVRGHGGLIVGPGSIFNGKRYMADRLEFPVALPAHVESMLSEAQATVKDRRTDYGDVTDWDTSNARSLVERVERGDIIKDYDGAFVEGERDNLTFQLFAFAKGRMIHPDAMLEAVLDAGIAGGLEDDVIGRKMESAYYDGNTQDGYGAKVDAYRNVIDFKPYKNGKPVDRPPADPVEWKAANLNLLPKFFPGDPQPEAPEQTAGQRAGRFKRWKLDELAQRTPPVWLTDRVIPAGGNVILYGAPSSFKTFLALDLALTIAARLPSWRDFPVKGGRVLYMMGEGSFDADKRVRAWCEHHGVPMPVSSFEIIEPAPMLRMPSDLDAFLAEAKAGGPWDLIVLDTIGRMMAAMNDNAAEHARMYSEFVGTIREKLGAATLGLTHSPKDRPEAMLGSGAFEADADVALNAVTTQEGRRIDLYQRKQKYAEPWSKLGFERVKVGESMTLKPCDPSRTERDKERQTSDVWAEQFRVALTRHLGSDGTAGWPDVRATMTAMNDARTGADARKLHVQINNWFKRWPDRDRYITGRRGEQNSLILSVPTDDRLSSR